MDHIENTLKIGVITSFLFVPLFVISPIVDHQFDSLENDVDSNKSRPKIFIDVMIHLVVLVILSYLFYRIFEHMLKRYMKIKMEDYIRDGYGIVGAVVLAGLQKNLMEKLDYLTSTHAIRQ